MDDDHENQAVAEGYGDGGMSGMCWATSGSLAKERRRPHPVGRRDIVRPCGAASNGCSLRRSLESSDHRRCR
jgi:hypothetical protein